MNTAVRIAENLAKIRGRISEAALRSGREPSDVTLVAVTKYVDIATTRAVVAAECFELGESRPQQLCAKASELADERVRWHLVGHLQRNKIRRTLAHNVLIHSVDRESTLQAIDRIAGDLSVDTQVLIEVNTSGDASKDGIAPAAVAQLIESAGSLPHVRVCGLMTMAALEGNDDVTRRNFNDLRELRNRLSMNLPKNVTLNDLSMGMSNDFEIAIEQGATLVRVGSAIVEGVTMQS